MIKNKTLFRCVLGISAIGIVALFSGSCSRNTNESHIVNKGGGEVKKIQKVDSINPGKPVVEIVDTSNLRIYFPKYSQVDFTTENMPSKDDSSVILVAEGAFTAGTPEEMAQAIIAGDHVSGGVRMKGYNCPRNNGAFVFYDGKPKFILKNYDKELDLAATNGGCGFTQEMMIHNGQIVSHTRPDGNVNQFRALCLIDDRLAIADSKDNVEFGNFINDLLKAGATEALYLDMGPGWNYSWYRDENGNPVDIHPESSVGTNWITFYQ